jgi:hypothetical protein
MKSKNEKQWDKLWKQIMQLWPEASQYEEV